MSNKIKVIGYAQRQFFTNGIEYRNFSDSLVGQQFTDGEGSAFFTSGNFSVTVNVEPKENKFLNKKPFSSYITLDDLDGNLETTTFVTNITKKPKLLLDKTNIRNFVYFGSFYELLRVSLEKIIEKWVAGLVLTVNSATTFNYSQQTNTTEVSFNKSIINNPHGISLEDTIPQDVEDYNKLRILKLSYSDFVFRINDKQYSVVSFSGLTNNTITFEVNGNPFLGLSGNTKLHITPNNQKAEEFFNDLGDFESYLLNRNTNPKYTAFFKLKTFNENGVGININRSFTWPVSDGYNIDFDSVSYILYVDRLIEIANDYDSNLTDIVRRELVSENLYDFDTVDTINIEDESQEDQKILKTIRIYGRSFDEIKKHINGIANSNVVSYDKKDNTPDVYVKNVAKILGWDLLSSIGDNNLIDIFINSNKSTYSGLNKGLSKYETEIEFWRRLIINSPWIWKSKGTRKTIEFLLRLIGTPEDLILLCEHVYKVKEPLNVDVITDIIVELGLEVEFNDLSIDNDGYPKIVNTPDRYYQSNGMWYRETSGSRSNYEYLEGNNPHIGIYDRGQHFLNQFKCLIPDFESVTLINEIVTEDKTNLFEIFNNGTFDDLPNNIETGYTFNGYNSEGVNMGDCVIIDASIISDPKPKSNLTECGCEENIDDKVLKISYKKKEEEFNFSDCNINSFSFSEDGYVLFVVNSGETKAIQPECCEAINQTPILIDGVGYYCAWREIFECENYSLNGFENDIAVWLTPNGKLTNNVQDPSCCGDLMVIDSGIEGLFNCVRESVELPQPECNDYTFSEVLIDGTVVWDTGNGTTTIVDSVECCTNNGYEVGDSGNGLICVADNPCAGTGCPDNFILTSANLNDNASFRVFDGNSYFGTGVVNYDCCILIGANPVQATQGCGFVCEVTESTIDVCDFYSWGGVKVNSADGFIIFDTLNGGESELVPTPECCQNIGPNSNYCFNAVQGQGDDSWGFNCQYTNTPTDPINEC